MKVGLAQNQIGRRIGGVQSRSRKAQQAVVPSVHNPKVALGVASDAARSVHVAFRDPTRVRAECVEIRLAVNRIRLRAGLPGGWPGKAEYTVIAEIGYIHVAGRRIHGDTPGKRESLCTGSVLRGLQRRGLSQHLRLSGGAPYQYPVIPSVGYIHQALGIDRHALRKIKTVGSELIEAV